MNEKQWQQIQEQLPARAKILRTYNAFENGELRIIVQLPGERFETRYIVHNYSLKKMSCGENRRTSGFFGVFYP